MTLVLSMTGFGRFAVNVDSGKVQVEMKSVNHRYNEVSVRLPKNFSYMEERIHKIVKRFVQRGKVDVFVSVDGQGALGRHVKVDWELLQGFMKSAEDMKKQTWFKDTSLSLESFLLHPDITTVEEEGDIPEEWEGALVQCVEESAAMLYRMRQTEGAALEKDINKRIDSISRMTDIIHARTGQVVENYREKLIKRMKDFLGGDYQLEEGRILTEVALFADKANIDEEITRLTSHVKQFLSIIEEKGSIGRKLDFLVQEMNREINTIGSKGNDIEISRQVVNLKSELEKVKEQVQNIE
ncbi:YicC/YloC family endoribonuclease [Thalassobacillus sp. C254]|uniref:YicC/YloC family endoribonuclease n=1 Tax=Thalassobacillus sp. C254 TaxID=1225341 RepID=UPI000A7EB3CD|nr:YicC/YloC family endoribonuclease [Thalassobacillus sp. C254]